MSIFTAKIDSVHRMFHLSGGRNTLWNYLHLIYFQNLDIFI